MGYTALHIGCENNSVECVELFLRHPKCNRDIVTSRNSDGKTAEMIATQKGYHECARLVREYLNRDQGRGVPGFAGAGHVGPADQAYLQGVSVSQLLDALKSRVDALKSRCKVPECPACYEEMRPPREIYTCGNGHLICNTCHDRIQNNRCVLRCGAEYTGRATAMEQMVRQILGIM